MTITKELLDALKEYVSGDKVRGTTSSATHLKALSAIAKAESAVRQQTIEECAKVCEGALFGAMKHGEREIWRAAQKQFSDAIRKLGAET